MWCWQRKKRVKTSFLAPPNASSIKCVGKHQSKDYTNTLYWMTLTKIQVQTKTKLAQDLSINPWFNFSPFNRSSISSWVFLILASLLSFLCILYFPDSSPMKRWTHKNCTNFKARANLSGLGAYCLWWWWWWWWSTIFFLFLVNKMFSFLNIFLNVFISYFLKLE